MGPNQLSLRQLLLCVTFVCIGLASAKYADPYTMGGALVKYLGAGAALGAALGVLCERPIVAALAGMGCGIFIALLL
jgi:hypothetical protein